MSFGFQSIANASGDIIIDQNYRNLRVFSEGTASVVSGAGAYSYPGIYVPFGSVPNPVVFMRLGSYQTIGGYLDGSNYRCGIVAPLGISIPYLVCSLDISGDAGSGYGVAIFDPQGRTVFSSNRKYVRIVQGLTSGINFGGTANVPTQSVSTSTGWIAPHSPTITGGFCDVVRVLRARRTSATNIFLDEGGASAIDIGPGATIGGVGDFMLGVTT